MRMNQPAQMQDAAGGGGLGEASRGVARVAWGHAGAPEEYLAQFVERQAELVGARCGAILRLSGRDEVDIVALWPALPPGGGGAPPPWLEAAGEAAAGWGMGAQAGTMVVELEGTGRRLLLGRLATPREGGVSLVAAYVVESLGEALERGRERLELSGSLAGVFDLRAALSRRTHDMARLKAAMEVLVAMNRHQRFQTAAMELVNQIAAIWRCERVSLGFVRGAYVRLRAMSHTDKAPTNSQVAQAIAGAMEECVDQDIEVWAPEAGAGDAVIRRQAEELALRDGQGWVCTLPLRVDGEVVGALTVERRSALTMDELEPLRLACELVSARLGELEERDRWIGARAALGVRRAAAWAVGAEHTWAKLLAIAALALVVFMVFVPGNYSVSAPFVLEATSRRAVPAPYDGYLASVDVRIGDHVREGQTLGTLDTSDLAMELAEARARAASAAREASIARSEGKVAESQIAEASQREAAARVELLEYRIERARLTAPMDGVVSVGDLASRTGGAVRLGETLFEIAQVDALRAMLHIPDDQVIDVRTGQRGELAVVAKPESRIGFTVEYISPVAEVIEGRNVFRARATLDPEAAIDWLRPGMEGVAHTHIGERSYGWIWTRRLVNWVRMGLWL
jgi:biotin carboxyl carrier protein